MLECVTMRGDAAWCAREHAPWMPLARLLEGNNLIFTRIQTFRKSLQARGQSAAKDIAKDTACSQNQGSPPRASFQGRGMYQPRMPHRQASKAKPRSQGRGSPHGQAAIAKVRRQGQGSPHM